MFSISLKSLSDQDRHDYILKTFVLNTNATSESLKYKRDIDVIKSNHRFLWDSSEDTIDNWEKKLARRYYDLLFKEYCIADLTRFKENKIALRWRIESEVISGKGQFQCGSRKCEERDGLRSWEVNFAYQEEGQRKNALVKLRLCPNHSTQLNYTSRKREVKRLKHAVKLKKKENTKHKKVKDYSQSVDENKREYDKEKLEDTLNNDLNEDNVNGSTNFDEKTDNVEDLEENIWKKKLDLTEEQPSREADFERFLEDLLL